MSPEKIRLAIGSDHAGFELKELLRRELPQIDWIDEGTDSTERTDYPDFARKVAEKVGGGEVERGVLVCGSGIGMCIAANKVPGVRAVAPESETAARLSRAHNDANVLCLGARLLKPEYAKQILEAWLETPFEGGRHLERVRKIAELEKRRHGPTKPSRK